MRKTQIEIYSNLEAYACLSYNAMTIKAIFQMKIKLEKKKKKWIH